MHNAEIFINSIKNSEEYKKRFNNRPIGSFIYNKIKYFYFHRDIQKMVKSKYKKSLNCYIYFFDKKKGISSFYFEDVKRSLSPVEILSLIKQRKKRNNFTLELNWLYKTIDVKLISKSYLEKLNSHYNYGNIDNNYYNSNFYSLDLRKKDFIKINININQLNSFNIDKTIINLENKFIKEQKTIYKFLAIKRTAMVKSFVSHLKEFLSLLPNDIIYIMRRHNSFNEKTFNYLYAQGNEKIKKLRIEAFQQHFWFMFSQENHFYERLNNARENNFLNRGDKEPIDLIESEMNSFYKEIDSGVKISDIILKKYQTSKGAIRFLHGLSFNHWKKASIRQEITIDFLRNTEGLLSILKGIKISQKTLHLLSILEIEQKVIKKIFSENFSENFLNINNLKYIDLYSKEILNIWRNGNNIDDLISFFKNHRSRELFDYFDEINWIKKALSSDSNLEDFFKFNSIKQIIKLSQNWHDEIVKIGELKREVSDSIEFEVFKEFDKWEKLEVDYKDGVFSITELTSKQDLIDESIALNHCVDGYFTYCSLHGGKIFSVEQNGEKIATIEINLPDKEKKAKILQLRGNKNTTPESTVEKVVLKWFNQNKELITKKITEQQNYFKERRKNKENIEKNNTELKKSIEAKKALTLLEKFPHCFPKKIND